MAVQHDIPYVGNVEEMRSRVRREPALLEARGLRGDTVLHRACEQGHEQVVGCLLEQGAPVNQQNDFGYTALYWACREGHLRVVNLLLGKGASLLITTKSGQTSPLIESSSSGRVEVVRSLLRHPQAALTLNQCDAFGKTALWWACYKGHDEVVMLLLEAGADPGLTDKYGVTPMAIATKHGHEDCIDLLKEWECSYLLVKARQISEGSFYNSSSFYEEDNVMQPVVEVEGADAMEVQIVGGTANREVDTDLLAKAVLDFVVCGGLTNDLFVELMDVMGKTGYREEVEKEKRRRAIKPMA